MPCGIDAEDDAIQALSAAIGYRIRSLSWTPAADLVVFENGGGVNVVLARAVWDGEVCQYVLPGGAAPCASDLVRAIAPATAALPPHISLVGGEGEGRGITYLLPEPEVALGGGARFLGQARMSEPKGAILAERHPAGEWRLYASLQDWVHARPFALASADMRLRELEHLSRARALFNTPQGSALTVSGASKYLSAVAKAEVGGDPALCAATLDTKWRARLDDVIERDALAGTNLVLASSPEDERGLVAAAHAALSAERVAARRARRGHTIPLAAVALTYDEILDGDVRRRFEDAWPAGGLGGTALNVERLIKEDRSARCILGSLPALLQTPGWGIAQPHADRTAAPIFLRLARRDIGVTGAVLNRMSQAGIVTKPLRSILAPDPAFHGLLGSIEGYPT